MRQTDTGDQDLSPGLGQDRRAGLCRLHFAVLAHGPVACCLGMRYPGPLPAGGFRKWGLGPACLEEAALGLQLQFLPLWLLKLLATPPESAATEGVEAVWLQRSALSPRARFYTYPTKHL